MQLITNATGPFRTVGLCALPLIGWLSGDWMVISMVTIMPLVVIYVGYCYVPESPRWLLTKGRTQEAGQILRDMAKVRPINCKHEENVTKLRSVS